MVGTPEPSNSAPGDQPSGLSPEEKRNLKKVAFFFIVAIGVILGLKILLGY